MAQECQNRLAGGNAPQPGCPVIGGCEDLGAVGGEHTRPDAQGMPSESALAVAGRDIPDIGSPIEGGGKELLAIGREGRARHRAI
eukprot:10517845-Alexandrium_andersonii.AAC.1